MKKRLIALLLVVVMLCTLLPIGALADQMVYITDTGSKYHEYGCRYLSESGYAVTLDYAVRCGYKPCSVCHKTSSGEQGVAGFVDVAPGKYYSNAVEWAVKNDITQGTDDTHFAPNDSCTRAQVVTFMWRAAGGPTVDVIMAFDDVHYTNYYYKAVRWAVKNGITSGVSADRFAPNEPCTRAQVVSFLYRAAGEPDVGNSCLFADVSANAYYCSAVIWAVENGITAGVTPNKFAPNATCTRGQIVTFLYRYYNSDTPDPTPTPKPTPDPTPTPTQNPSGDSEYIVSGKLPYPCPTPASGIPAPTDTATHDNVLALLDKYCPNGSYILRDSEANGDDFMTWMNMGSLMEMIDTAVHEECHGYTIKNGTGGYIYDPSSGKYTSDLSYAYYVGEGSHILVPELSSYKTEEIAAIVPESLRTDRYSTYVGADSELSANLNGIYGLMNEFTAYSWGSLAGISLYEYYLTQPITAENWLKYIGISSGTYQAYSEFKFFILSYMIYAKDNYPEIYAETMGNQAILDTFRIVEARYRATVERYFDNLDKLEAYLNDNGLYALRKNDVFYISDDGLSYSGVGTFADVYNLLENAMQAPEYVEMYNLMTK